MTWHVNPLQGMREPPSARGSPGVRAGNSAGGGGAQLARSVVRTQRTLPRSRKSVAFELQEHQWDLRWQGMPQAALPAPSLPDPSFITWGGEFTCAVPTQGGFEWLPHLPPRCGWKTREGRVGGSPQAVFAHRRYHCGSVWAEPAPEQNN
jgi:hypothetical protein